MRDHPRPRQTRVRCSHCQTHDREVQALSRSFEGDYDTDEIIVSHLSSRQQDERRRRAEDDYRRGSRASLSTRDPSPRRRDPSPEPRRTLGYELRAQEEEDDRAEEEEEYRYNWRREEMRRRKEDRRSEEDRRGYPTSNQRHGRSVHWY